MAKIDRLIFSDGVQARCLKHGGLLVLSGLTEAGAEAEVTIPLQALSAVMEAVEAASAERDIRAEDLPTVSGVLHCGEVQIGVVPKAGLAMRLILSDGREAMVLFQSRGDEALLRCAAERVTAGLALAFRGPPH